MWSHGMRVRHLARYHPTGRRQQPGTGGSQPHLCDHAVVWPVPPPSMPPEPKALGGNLHFHNASMVLDRFRTGIGDHQPWTEDGCSRTYSSVRLLHPVDRWGATRGNSLARPAIIGNHFLIRGVKWISGWIILIVHVGVRRMGVRSRRRRLRHAKIPSRLQTDRDLPAPP